MEMRPKFPFWFLDLDAVNRINDGVITLCVGERKNTAKNAPPYLRILSDFFALYHPGIIGTSIYC